MFASFIKGGCIAVAILSSVFTMVGFTCVFTTVGFTCVSVFRPAFPALSPSVLRVERQCAQFPLLPVGTWACVGEKVTFLNCWRLLTKLAPLGWLPLEWQVGLEVIISRMQMGLPTGVADQCASRSLPTSLG